MTHVARNWCRPGSLSVTALVSARLENDKAGDSKDGKDAKCDADLLVAREAPRVVSRCRSLAPALAKRGQ